MKATGIVRRIDDLGRVVIPKEIRRTMRIREGEPLEIFTGTNGEVVFRKYSPVGAISQYAEHFADVINRLTGHSCIITDRDVIVACSGVAKKEYLERRLSMWGSEIIAERKTYYNADGTDNHRPVEGIEKDAYAAVPIVMNGDVVGAVILLSGEDRNFKEKNGIILTTSALLLGRQLED